MERTRNASRNIAAGVLQKSYQIVMPFLMRMAMIYLMGVQYLGLSSLFTSILQVLNLAELGVGAAMVYCMYRPIAEDNRAEICALMALYRTYYRLIGLAVAAMGLALYPFIPRLIHGTVPENVNVHILYLMNLGVTVLSYWLFAYRNCLITAYQRTDVESKVLLATNTFQYAAQLLVMAVWKNYYLYLMAALFTQALTNLVTAYVTTRMFPGYRPEGKLDPAVIRQINHRIRDLFTSKLGSVIVNSVDTIVISAFLGLSVLAVYQNYYYIIASLKNFVTIFFTACAAGVGNSIVVETREKNYGDLKKITFLILWVTGFCSACLLCLYQPFMRILVGESLMLGMGEVVCFCIYFYILEISQILVLYKDAAGIWHEDRFRPLLTALANLTMNLLLVRHWGIYGIILSTVLSFAFIGIPWLLRNVFTVIFDRALLGEYLAKLCKYIAVTVLACFASWLLCSFVHLGKWGTFLASGAICAIVPNLVFLLFYHRQPEFAQSLELADRITKGKLRLHKR